MTQYLLACRPGALPPFPHLSLDRRTPALLAEARAYVDATAEAGFLALDSETMAVERPGADPESLFTDREFAQAVLAEPEDSDFDGAVEPTEKQSFPADRLSPRQLAMRGPFVVGKLPIGRGVAVMNSQVLRSAVFCRPELGVPNPTLSDLRGYEISVDHVSLTQNHLDLLLFAISCIRHDPPANQPAVVSFTRRKFLDTMGWTKSVDGYERLSKVASEMAAVRLTFRDGTRPATNGVVNGAPLLERVELFGTSGQGPCTLALSGSLCGLLRFGRNTVVDLEARAAMRGEFGRWLHAFVSSQKPGELRRYDAEAVCAAGGLMASRLTDRLKTLRNTLAELEGGAPSRGYRRTPCRAATSPMAAPRRFASVVLPGWRVFKGATGWQLELTRSA